MQRVLLNPGTLLCSVFHAQSDAVPFEERDTSAELCLLLKSMENYYTAKNIILSCDEQNIRGRFY